MTHSEPALVEYASENDIVWIRLNRPSKLNAFNGELKNALSNALQRFDRDEQANIAILHGAGSAFSSGADISTEHDIAEDERERRLGGAFESHLADGLTYAQNWKPVIGAGHGYILGSALGLFLSCDLTVVSTDAKLQIAETARGLWAGPYWNQVRLRAGATLADDMALSGRMVSGAEAASRGLVGMVVEPDELLGTAKRLALDVLENPQSAVRAAVMTRRWTLNREQRDWPLLKAATPLHQSADFRRLAQQFGSDHD